MKTSMSAEYSEQSEQTGYEAPCCAVLLLVSTSAEACMHPEHEHEHELPYRLHPNPSRDQG